jgi:hypothetical protein
MKREIKEIARLEQFCGCCPGHDIFPDETYSSRRSKRARARDIKKEHRYVRRKTKQDLSLEIHQ